MRGCVTVLVCVLAAAGCQRSAATGPAWPAPAITDDDGGESLEPRQTSVATALEKADDDEPVEPVVEAAKPAATPAPAAEPETAAAVSPPTQPTTDEVIIHEEIIIEIEDE